MEHKTVNLIAADQGELLYLIDLPQEMPGFKRFLAAWLLVTPTTTYLVDPGPMASIPHLVQALEELGVQRLDYVLLTHVHLDHAGGTGRLLEHFPEAKVFAHPRGRPHLVAPQALWEASLKVMEELAPYYGRPRPLPQAHLVESVPYVEVIETPGHASHHVCYRHRNILFVGEAAGVHRNVDGLYLRPATPPRFFFEEAVASLDKLLHLNLEGTLLCHGHYGANTKAREILTLHRAQLFLWREVAADLLGRAVDERAWFDLVRTTLLQRDPLLVRFPALPPDIKKREEYFLNNSLEGFRGDLLSASHS